MTLGAALASLWIWLGVVTAVAAFVVWAAGTIFFDQRRDDDSFVSEPVAVEAMPSFSGIGSDASGLVLGPGFDLDRKVA